MKFPKHLNMYDIAKHACVRKIDTRGTKTGIDPLVVQATIYFAVGTERSCESIPNVACFDEVGEKTWETE